MAPPKKKTASAPKAAPAKKAVKKAAKKAAAPKAASAAPKKSAAKKAPVKKAAVKKAPAKKAATKKAAKAAPIQTSILARIDVGFGSSLYIRGEGGGLSWNKGTLMECISSDEWAFTSKTAKTGIVFKFLLNDDQWASGEDLTVPAGGTSITTPTFE